MTSPRKKSGSSLQNHDPPVSLFMSSSPNDYLKTHKTIRLAVSGDVHLSRLETSIVDTLDFQRLRGIKQLGTTYLVYPTALHTRFDHSLGTLGMVTQMILAIRQNKHNSSPESAIAPEQEIMARLLALLHDIGHVPFGHTLEDEFCIFPRHDEDDDRVQTLLGEESAIGNLIRTNLGEDLYKRFMNIYRAKDDTVAGLADDAFIADLVSNTVCADLLDYLRRDCYFCNIVLDMDYRFLNYLYLSSVEGPKRVVVRLWKEGQPKPRRDVLSELTRLLDNRYLLGERVYFHHAKLISGTMLAGAVFRATQSGELKKQDLFALSDDGLLLRLTSSKDPVIARLADGVLKRQLWKQVDERRRQEIDADQSASRDRGVWDDLMKRYRQDPLNRAETEDLIAGSLGLDPADVLIYCPDSRMAMKLARMKVFWNGHLRELKDCTDERVVGSRLRSTLSSHENLWSLRIFLHPSKGSEEARVVNAARAHFTYEPQTRERAEKRFYRDIVEAQAARLPHVGQITHGEYESCASSAMASIAADTASLKSAETLREIVRNAFSRVQHGTQDRA